MQFPPPTNRILSEDNRLRSAERYARYLVLRGVNFGPSAKLPPYLPFRSREDWEKYETYVDLLIACGFTVLRIPFIWFAFEPTCNPDQPEYNEQYLEDFFYFIRRFAEKGFLIIIDLHQDLVGRAFGGNGMPDWVLSEGARQFSVMNNTALWGLNYVFNRHLRKTFTEFWSNDLTNPVNDPPLLHFPVLDRYLEMVDRIAEEAAKIDRVFGIEIFNEPHPARVNNVKFEEEILPAFYSNAIERIRKHSSDLFALVSPQSDWNVNIREDKFYNSHLLNLGSDKRVVFAYHYYDSALTGLYGMLFNDAKREEYHDAQRVGIIRGREKGMVPFLTEFGTRQNWLTSIVRRHMNWQYEGVEAASVHATYWNVNLYNTRESYDGFMKEDFSLLGPGDDLLSPMPRNLDVATRPYVQMASAEPVHQHFNLRTKEYELVLRGKAVGTLPTVIYIPSLRLHPLQPVHYPDGFETQYNGILDSEFADNQLSITLDSEIELHEIVIRAK